MHRVTHSMSGRRLASPPITGELIEIGTEGRRLIYSATAV